MKDIVKKLLSLIGVSPLLKRTLSVFAYVVVPVVGVGISVIIPSVEIFRQFGELAQLGLLAILFMKPIAFIVPLRFLKRALMYRRQMGVAVFWLALFHSIGFMHAYGLWSIGGFVGWKNFLLYGGIAMIAMTILGITSNDISVRFFRGNWKRIQYLAYPTLFLVLLHSSMVKGEFIKILVVGGVYLAVKYLEVKGFRLNRHLSFIHGPS